LWYRVKTFLLVDDMYIRVSLLHDIYSICSSSHKDSIEYFDTLSALRTIQSILHTQPQHCNQTHWIQFKQPSRCPLPPRTLQPLSTPVFKTISALTTGSALRKNIA
jgi:hypothetical protein